MRELQDMLRVQARLHRKQGANALGDLFDNANEEIGSLKELLAKANERVSELEKQFETQMTNDFVTTTDQAKRIDELEKYNLDLANESHNKSLAIERANKRVKELEIKSQILLIENDFMRGFILDDYSVNPIWLDEQLEQLRKEQASE